MEADRIGHYDEYEAIIETIKSGAQISDSAFLSLFDTTRTELYYGPRASLHAISIPYGQCHLIKDAADRIDLTVHLIRMLYEARTDSIDLQAVLDRCVAVGALCPGPDCALHESHQFIRDNLRPALSRYLSENFVRCPSSRIQKWVQYGLGAVFNNCDKFVFDDPDLHMGQIVLATLRYGLRSPDQIHDIVAASAAVLTRTNNIQTSVFDVGRLFEGRPRISLQGRSLSPDRIVGQYSDRVSVIRGGTVNDAECGRYDLVVDTRNPNPNPNILETPNSILLLVDTSITTLRQLTTALTATPSTDLHIVVLDRMEAPLTLRDLVHRIASRSDENHPTTWLHMFENARQLRLARRRIVERGAWCQFSDRPRTWWELVRERLRSGLCVDIDEEWCYMESVISISHTEWDLSRTYHHININRNFMRNFIEPHTIIQTEYQSNHTLQPLLECQLIGDIVISGDALRSPSRLYGVVQVRPGTVPAPAPIQIAPFTVKQLYEMMSNDEGRVTRDSFCAKFGTDSVTVFDLHRHGPNDGLDRISFQRALQDITVQPAPTSEHVTNTPVEWIGVTLREAALLHKKLINDTGSVSNIITVYIGQYQIWPNDHTTVNVLPDHIVHNISYIRDPISYLGYYNDITDWFICTNAYTDWPHHHILPFWLNRHTKQGRSHIRALVQYVRLINHEHKNNLDPEQARNLLTTITTPYTAVQILNRHRPRTIPTQTSQQYREQDNPVQDTWSAQDMVIMNVLDHSLSAAYDCDQASHQDRVRIAYLRRGLCRIRAQIGCTTRTRTETVEQIECSWTESVLPADGPIEVHHFISWIHRAVSVSDTFQALTHKSATDLFSILRHKVDSKTALALIRLVPEP